MNKTTSEKTTSSVGQSLSGKYKVSVLDKDNNIVWEQKDWQKNLILNQGMDALATTTYANVMVYAAMGNGFAENSASSNGSSGSVTGSTLTLLPVGTGLQSLTSSYGGWPSIVQVGDMIHFADSSEVMVLGVSNLTASVTPDILVNSQSFLIYKTSQIGLQSEIHRVGNFNYFAGVGYCGTTVVGNTFQNRRTWDFNYEVSTVAITEVGVGWASSGNNTIFSRIKLPSTVTINAGQKMRLIYELDISMFPSASSPGVPFTASIIGWGTGSLVPGYQNIGNYLLSTIGTDGTSGGAAVLDPGNNSGAAIFASNSTNANGDSGGTPVNRAGTSHDATGMTSSPYVPLSFTIYKNGTFNTSQLAENDLRTIGIGYYPNQSFPPWFLGNDAFCCVFDQPQTKLNTQTLTLSFIYTWGRILS